LINYGQSQNNKDFPKKNIFLFGEVHFVKEKYSEIKESITSIIDTTNNSDTVNLFLELPTSFEFVLYRLKEFNDTTFFNNYYNNMYYKKDPPSKFWLDFKELLLSFINYCESKKLEWNIRCIDIERNFRNTAYVLNFFDPEIDSLLSQKYIMDDSLNRNYLIQKTGEFCLSRKFNEKELFYLKRINKSLNIDCQLCQKRDSFMYSQFTEFVDSVNNLNFGIFGIKHLLLRKSHSSDKNSFTHSQFKVEEGEMIPFYGLFSDYLRNRTFKIGILALEHKIFDSGLSITKDYDYLMSDSEREYILSMLAGSKVIRCTTKSHKTQLNELNEILDYLIVYKESQYAR